MNGNTAGIILKSRSNLKFYRFPNNRYGKYIFRCAQSELFVITFDKILMVTEAEDISKKYTDFSVTLALSAFYRLYGKYDQNLKPVANLKES